LKGGRTIGQLKKALSAFNTFVKVIKKTDPGNYHLPEVLKIIPWIKKKLK
jgi:hypothetical protein